MSDAVAGGVVHPAVVMNLAEMFLIGAINIALIVYFCDFLRLRIDDVAHKVIFGVNGVIISNDGGWGKDMLYYI